MIKDTYYDLRLHLQRINEKLSSEEVSSTVEDHTRIDLQDEKAITQHCLLICDEAKSYIETLQTRQRSIFQAHEPVMSKMKDLFEAHMLMDKALERGRYGFAKL